MRVGRVFIRKNQAVGPEIRALYFHHYYGPLKAEIPMDLS